MQQQLAPAAPPAAARPPYRLVQANAERFAHQQQAMRGGTVRAIIDKRQLCELVVQMQDAQGQLVEPLSLRMGVVQLEMTVHIAGTPEPLRVEGDERISWRSKVLDGDERKLYALSGRRHDGLLMHTSQLTFSFKLLLLSKEVDGKMLQLKVAPVGDAHRQWIEPLLTMPVICMSRKPDSRRPPEPARPPLPLFLDAPPPPAPPPPAVLPPAPALAAQGQLVEAAARAAAAAGRRRRRRRRRRRAPRRTTRAPPQPRGPPQRRSPLRRRRRCASRRRPPPPPPPPPPPRRRGDR